jgi:hypothetical protein
LAQHVGEQVHMKPQPQRAVPISIGPFYMPARLTREVQPFGAEGDVDAVVLVLG